MNVAKAPLERSSGSCIRPVKGMGAIDGLSPGSAIKNVT